MPYILNFFTLKYNYNTNNTPSVKIIYIVQNFKQG